MDVAAILRRAGARLHTGAEDSALDPRIHFQIISKIQRLILAARMSYPTESAEEIARHVIEKLDLTFPDSMPLEQQEMTKKEIHALIMKECKN
jgi:hypothetical protein